MELGLKIRKEPGKKLNLQFILIELPTSETEDYYCSLNI